MKKTTIFGVLLCLFAISAVGNDALNIIERGPDHKRLERTISLTNAHGQVTSKLSQYVEVATGMHYFENGEWKRTDPRIEIDALGGFVDKGPHKVRFAPNLNTAGAVELTLPCGKILRSHVAGLSYFDPTGKSVLIAEIKDSIGEVVGGNQIIYRDAFTDFKADVRYTYSEWGLEQDIIIREQPPSPQEYGLHPKATRLQVLTEFIQPPIPTKVQALIGGMQVDELIDFGSMCIGHGKAFFENGPSVDVPVDKVWTQMEGRDFLIEEVEFEIVEDQIEALPLAPQARIRLHAPDVAKTASKLRLPGPKQAKASRKRIRVASYHPAEPGFVLDYLILNSTANMVFKSDTTYYIGESVTLTGTTVFEGGAVIKFTNGVNNLRISQSSGSIISDTAPHRPVIFTSKDDDTVGEPIAGSTGVPLISSNSSQFIRISSMSADLSNFRFSYANTAVEYTSASSRSNTLSNVQFLNCDTGIRGASARFFVRNALFFNVATAFKCSSATGAVEHLTLSQAGQLMVAENSSTHISFTNSLFVAVTNFGSTNFSTNYVESIADPADAFDAAVAGAHYLKADTTFTNGTTLIESGLLASLSRKTTHPPTIWTNNVTNSTVLNPVVERGDPVNIHLGFHYDPIDYIFSNIVVSNAVLTLTNGVVIGLHGEHGLTLDSGSQFTSEGSPLNLNKIVHPLSAQEGIGTNWNSRIQSVFGEVPAAQTSPIVSLRFTELSLASGSGNFVVSGSNIETLHMRDSQVFGGAFLFQTNGNSSSVFLTNNLFNRVRFKVETGTNVNSLLLFNNTFNEGEFYLSPEVGSTWLVQDNFFNLVAITQNVVSIVSSNNGYVLTNSLRLSPTNSGDVVLSGAEFASGPLGRFYYLTNSALIDSGSRTVAEAGLSHYTVTTNQANDVSLVDIGFHYVAVDESGHPKDSDGDGVPDYIEDANGNGSLDSGETPHDDYYNGELPVLEILQSGEEWLEPGTTATNGIVIRVKTSSSSVLTNAPITLEVSQGPASFSSENVVQSISLRTDSSGESAPAFITVPIDVLGQTFDVVITANTSSGSVSENIPKTILEKVVTPRLSPPSATFAIFEDVRISCGTAGAALHYSLNGVEPTTNHPTIGSGDYLRLHSSGNLKVKGFLGGSLASKTEDGFYTRAAGINAARNQSFAIRADGNVFAWGENTYGQLGTGTNIHLANPTLVLSNFNLIAGGDLHTLGLSNETVWAWGYGALGRLGHGTTETKYWPVAVLDGVKAISAGYAHSLALDTNGSVWAWGWNDSGRLGDGTTAQKNSPVQLTNLSNFSAIAAGQNYSFAISNGNVWAWGNNDQGRLGDGTTDQRVTPVEIGLTNVSAIAAGDGHSLAISNGVVYSWGRGVWGRLGLGDSSNQLVPVRTSLSNIVSIAAGTDHSLALDTEGRVWSWGYNSWGQLGDGTQSIRNTPVCVASNIVGIAAGFRHSLALREDGVLLTWGRQDFGQLGNGQFDYSYSPTHITNLPPAQAISSGDYHYLVLLSNQTIMAWGNNNTGQIGTGSNSDNIPYITNVFGLTNVTAISAGANHNLAISNGTVWAWGEGQSGKIGDGGTANRYVPTKVNNLEFVTAISAGGTFSAAISNQNVWTWGQGERLGNGGTANQTSPVNASIGGAPFSEVTFLSAGNIHTLALKGTNHQVWAWGDNQFARLGDGTTTDRLEPVQSTNITGSYLEGFSVVAGGHEHSLAISNGIVWSWGDNDHGQLGDPWGDNSIARRQTPTAILLSNIVAVAAGADHSLALNTNGSVYAWGRNQRGQLGTGNIDSSITPILVPNLTNVIAIAAGGFNSMALLADGSVLVWGDAAEGQMADGNVGYKTVPTPASINDLNYNDPPIITAPESVVGLEDFPITNQVTVVDWDAEDGDVSLTISAANGMPFLVLTNGLLLLDGTNGVTTNLTVQGTIANINLALADLVYWPHTNYWGSDSLQLTVDDMGNSGADGAKISFAEIDVQILPVNDAPEFDAGENVTVLEDAIVNDMPWAASVNAGDFEMHQTLLFSVTNSNPSLFAVQPTISVDGKLSFVLETNGHGSALLTAILFDDGGTENGGIEESQPITFSITVQSVNDAPTINSLSDLEINEDASEQTINLTGIGSGAANEIQTLSVIAFSSNTNLIPEVSIQYDSPNNTGILKFTPWPDRSGAAAIIVVVQDDGGNDLGGADSVTNSFIVTVNPVNDEPSFILSSKNIIVLEDCGEQVRTNWVTEIDRGSVEEAEQQITFILANTRPELFSVQPSISEEGTLTFTPASDAYGNAVVSVVLQDNGGTLYGGTNTFTNFFTIWIGAVDDAPIIGPITPIEVNEDPGKLSITIPVSVGPENESHQSIVSLTVASDNSTLVPSPKLLYTNKQSSAILEFTPTENLFGSIVFTLIAEDDGNDSNGGLYLTTNTVSVSINSVNDAPSFVKGSNQLLQVGEVASPVIGWASLITAGPANESNQNVSFVVTNDNGALFLTQPAVTPTGTLSYTPASGAFGMANVFVTLMDDGGTENGGVDSSAIQQFTITVTNIVATPKFLPSHGCFPFPPHEVAISCDTAGAVIHYTLDGSFPTESDLTVTNGGVVEVPNFGVLKARAFKNDWTPSLVSSQVFRSIGKISAGWTHSLFLKPNLEVLAWGDNWEGILGVSGPEEVPLPVPVGGLSQIVEVEGGVNYSIALDGNGDVFTWGGNWGGELGDGSAVEFRSAPAQLLSISNIIKVQAGQWNGFAISSDRKLLSWGWNDGGQLGNGTTSNSFVPIEVTGLTGVKGADAGGSHSIALTTNGTVFTWGDNESGQLGDGTTDQKLAPIEVQGLSNIVEISAGSRFSLALEASGVAWAWGENTYGQLANGSDYDTDLPAQVVGLTNVIALDAGNYHSTFLLKDGTVWGAGRKKSLGSYVGQEFWHNTPIQIIGLSNIVSISSEGDQNFAIDINGAIWAWGENWYGALGVGHLDDFTNAVMISFDSADEDNDGLLDGSEILFGTDPYFADSDLDGASDLQEFLLGTDPLDFYNGLSPTLTIISGDEQQGANGELLSHAIVLKVTGTNSNVISNAPVFVTLYPEQAVLQDFGTHGQFRTDEMGEISIFVRCPSQATNGSVTFTAFYGTNSVIVQATFSCSELTVVDPTFIPDGGSFQVFKIITVSCATPGAIIHYTIDGSEPTVLDPVLPTDGKLLVDRSMTVRAKAWKGACVPSQVSSATYVFKPGAVTAGKDHTLMMKPTGTLWTWGSNGEGQLGCGLTGDQNLPVLLSLSNVIEIAAGSAHSLSLMADGFVHSWGENAAGQLGNGTLQSTNLPTLIPSLSNIIAIAAGSNHSLALMSNGTLFAWGENQSGQLGLGSTENTNIPTVVEGIQGSVIAIGAGASHSVAQCADGSIWMWGGNEYGQLGNNQTNASLVPVSITNFSNLKSVYVGYSSSFAVLSNKTVYGWGDNSFGQLGNGTTNALYVPTEMTWLADMVAIGRKHSLILNNSDVSATGFNEDGQLGIGTTNSVVSPVALTNLSEIMDIAAGFGHSVALQSNQIVHAWGNNLLGQVGIGTNLPSILVPTKVGGDDDLDGDGLAGWLEFQHGSNPNSTNSDNDDADDVAEIIRGSNPSTGSQTNDLYLQLKLLSPSHQ